MVEFDAEAYNAASNLFRSAQMVRKSLPSIIAQIADSVDQEIANRSPEQGNTVEGVNAYRDKMIVEILRLQGML